MKRIFNLFKKNKKIEFQCLVEHLDPNVLYPPIESSKLPLPNWYKERAKAYKTQLEVAKCPFKSHPSVGDVVRCPGIKDLVNSGITIRMWSDFFIDLPRSHPQSSKELNFGFGRGLEGSPELRQFATISHHHHSQFPEIFDKGKIYPLIIKLSFPWKVKAPRGVAFYMLPSYYSDQTNFSITPGVYDPVYINHVIVNMIVYMQEGRLIIPGGTPMCKLIPFYKEEKYNLSVLPFQKHDTTRLTEQIHLLNRFKFDYDALIKEREKMFNIFTD